MDRAPLIVKHFTEADRGRWDAFVRGCEEATFFHLSAWQGIVRDVFRHPTYFLYAERAGDIVAVLPLAHVRSRLFGNALTSLPFCVYGGIAGGPEGVAELEQAADALARRLGVQHLEFRNLTTRHADWPRQDLYATFRKAIVADEEANLNAIPRKQRAMVRKGIDAQLKAEAGTDVDTFYAMYSESVRNLGTPVLGKRFFAALMGEFGSRADVLTVSHSGSTVSSVLSFYFRDEVLPYYGGGTAAARDLKANDFMYWALMQHSVARGATPLSPAAGQL